MFILPVLNAATPNAQVCMCTVGSVGCVHVLNMSRGSRLCLMDLRRVKSSVVGVLRQSTRTTKVGTHPHITKHTHSLDCVSVRVPTYTSSCSHTRIAPELGSPTCSPLHRLPDIATNVVPTLVPSADPDPPPRTSRGWVKLRDCGVPGSYRGT